MRKLEDPAGFSPRPAGRRVLLDEVHRLGNPSELLKIAADLSDFERSELERRLLRGGLPPMFLADQLPERDFQDWMDSWAKDNPGAVPAGATLLVSAIPRTALRAERGEFEATRFAAPCEVSRQTISNYLAALEATFVAHVVRSFSSRSANEIVARPIAIECKWRASSFDPSPLAAFRRPLHRRPELRRRRRCRHALQAPIRRLRSPVRPLEVLIDQLIA